MQMYELEWVLILIQIILEELAKESVNEVILVVWKMISIQHQSFIEYIQDARYLIETHAKEMWAFEITDDLPCLHQAKVVIIEILAVKYKFTL